MKFAIYGQYYQNNTDEIVEKVLSFFHRHSIEIVFEEQFQKSLKLPMAKKCKSFSHHNELNENILLFSSN